MPVNAPISVTSPPPEQELFIVRGDRFVLDLGFTDIADAATIVVTNRLRLTIRRRQSDSMPTLVSVNATLTADPGDSVGGVPLDIAATFVLTPEQTAGLPMEGAFYLIEWTDLVGGSNSRVVQGRVRVGD